MRSVSRPDRRSCPAGERVPLDTWAGLEVDHAEGSSPDPAAAQRGNGVVDLVLTAQRTIGGGRRVHLRPHLGGALRLACQGANDVPDQPRTWSQPSSMRSWQDRQRRAYGTASSRAAGIGRWHVSQFP